MNAKKDKNQLNAICFIGLCAVGDDAGMYRGGALLTDSQGKPLEFRCTSVIQPNSVQEILFGRTFWPHVCIKLIAQPLFDAIQEKPDIIVVNDQHFLGLRESRNTPLLLAAKQGGTKELADTENGGIEQSKGEVLNNPARKFAPVVVTSHGDFAGDLKAFDLHTLFHSIDLTEPLVRVKAALDAVHQDYLDKK